MTNVQDQSMSMGRETCLQSTKSIPDIATILAIHSTTTMIKKNIPRSMVASVVIGVDGIVGGRTHPLDLRVVLAVRLLVTLTLATVVDVTVIAVATMVINTKTVVLTVEQWRLENENEGGHSDLQKMMMMPLQLLLFHQRRIANKGAPVGEKDVDFHDDDDHDRETITRRNGTNLNTPTLPPLLLRTRILPIDPDDLDNRKNLIHVIKDQVDGEIGIIIPETTTTEPS